MESVAAKNEEILTAGDDGAEGNVERSSVRGRLVGRLSEPGDSKAFLFAIVLLYYACCVCYQTDEVICSTLAFL